MTLRVSLFLYPECAGKGECWASKSHQAHSSFCDCNKKALCERPSRILCAVSFDYYCCCYCCFFSIFFKSHCGCNDLFNAKTTWKEKKLEHAIYLGWSPFELPPHTTHISGETHKTKNGICSSCCTCFLLTVLHLKTQILSQRTLHLLKGHFFLGFHCSARCFIDKYRIYKIIDVDYWYCRGITIPGNVH